jgi:NitT/TauT family transport system ATP-binding protein
LWPLNERFFLDLLGRGFSEAEARAQLNTAIGWGRYGELFEFDANNGELVRTDPETHLQIENSVMPTGM